MKASTARICEFSETNSNAEALTVSGFGPDDAATAP